MPTVIKMASHAYYYLTIFDNDTVCALHLGRTRCIASADQRIVLLAVDQGGVAVSAKALRIFAADVVALANCPTSYSARLTSLR